MSKNRHGILLNENNDLVIQNHDLVIGDTTTQDAKINVKAKPGDLKHAPTIGGDIARAAKMRKTDFTFKLEPRIKESLNTSGFSGEQITQIVTTLKTNLNE